MTQMIDHDNISMTDIALENYSKDLFKHWFHHILYGFFDTTVVKSYYFKFEHNQLNKFHRLFCINSVKIVDPNFDIDIRLIITLNTLRDIGIKNTHHQNILLQVFDKKKASYIFFNKQR